MGGFALIAGVAAVAGALVGRWLSVIPIALVWLGYATGLERGWWGNGVGDGWIAALLLGIAAAALGAAAGVALRRTVQRRNAGVFGR